MQPRLIATLLILVMVSCVAAQVNTSEANSDEQTAQTIRNLTQRWDEAMAKGDVAALKTILSDNYVHSGLPKDQWLALISAMEITYTSYKREVDQIQVYGDAAISFARNSLSGKYPGSQFSSVFNSMDVWIRKDGQWRCVATMANQIKDADKNKEEKMVRFGPDVKYSFVVYFKKKVTEEEIESFLRQNIHETREDGKGHSFRTGICEYLRLLPLQDHEAFAIQICEDAAPYERENVKRRLKASAIVHRALENMTPADVKTLK